mmetsp:Transcript_8190/g.18321  ORF Transcript_8190/g.18321 Transcript_8190/m.18321 type:complete len:217 (+) Transcript_8190:164-814(+)
MACNRPIAAAFFLAVSSCIIVPPTLASRAAAHGSASAPTSTPCTLGSFLIAYHAIKIKRDTLSRSCCVLPSPSSLNDPKVLLRLATSQPITADGSLSSPASYPSCSFLTSACRLLTFDKAFCAASLSAPVIFLSEGSISDNRRESMPGGSMALAGADTATRRPPPISSLLNGARLLCPMKALLGVSSHANTMHTNIRTCIPPTERIGDLQCPKRVG